MRTKNQLLSNFVLKIVALLTMTIDHIGMFLLSYSPNLRNMFDDPNFFNYPQNTIGYIFKIIGRLSFPIFAFLIAEGMHHSKNKIKYILRLSIFATLLLACMFIMNYGLGMNGLPANIFIDLALGAICIYLFEKKNWYSLLAILPFGYNVLVFIINSYFYNASWLPTIVRSQYSLYGILLMLGFYYSKKLASKYIDITCKKQNIDPTALHDTMYEENIKNIISVFVLTLFTVIFWALTYVDRQLDIYTMRFQSYAILAGVFIFLYNGKLGYKSKWFQYASYLYYPLHLVIIYMVFYAIYLL